MTIKPYHTAREQMIVNKLNKLTAYSTFWDDVRKLTAKVTSDRTLSMWQCMAEQRAAELLTGVEDVRIEVEYGQPTRYYTSDYSKEVFPITG